MAPYASFAFLSAVRKLDAFDPCSDRRNDDQSRASDPRGTTAIRGYTRHEETITIVLVLAKDGTTSRWFEESATVAMSPGQTNERRDLRQPIDE